MRLMRMDLMKCSPHSCATALASIVLPVLVSVPTFILPAHTHTHRHLSTHTLTYIQDAPMRAVQQHARAQAQRERGEDVRVLGRPQERLDQHLRSATGESTDQ